LARAEASVEIARPIEEVFAILTDPEQTRRWFPVEVDEHWTSPPPRGVGSTRHATVRMFGRRTENDAVVTEYDPPRRGVMVVDSGGATVGVALDFAPIEGGTRVAVTFDAQGRGLTGLLLGPFLGWYARSWRTGLANLKRMMEAGEL
jgi:uncharacterized protein YndB with AHSA1/START domain